MEVCRKSVNLSDKKKENYNQAETTPTYNQRQSANPSSEKKPTIVQAFITQSFFRKSRWFSSYKQKPAKQGIIFPVKYNFYFHVKFPYIVLRHEFWLANLSF